MKGKIGNGSLNWPIIIFYRLQVFNNFPQKNMKLEEPMVAQEGQFSPEQKPQVIQSVQALEAQQVLVYKVIQWSYNQQYFTKLLQLQIIISEQLPQLPSEYIHKVLFNKNYTSLLIILHDRIIGGATFRLFQKKFFTELTFFVISSKYQSQGFGKRLMEILKGTDSNNEEFLNSRSIKHILTFADDSARIFFKKQGFSKEITLPRQVWHGLIKQYSGSKLMECRISSSINYIISNQIIERQKQYINQQIKLHCIAQVSPKRSLLSAIRQKKSFLDPLPEISLCQIVRKLHGLDKYENKPRDSTLQESNFKVSLQEEYKDMMYQILNQAQSLSFHLDKYFYENKPDLENKLNGVNFPIIFRKTQNGEYSNLSEFIKDINLFIVLLQELYKEGEKRSSALKLKEFIESKIQNLRYLDDILENRVKQKQLEANQIQQENLSFNSQ